MSNIYTTTVPVAIRRVMVEAGIDVTDEYIGFTDKNFVDEFEIDPVRLLLEAMEKGKNNLVNIMRKYVPDADVLNIYFENNKLRITVDAWMPDDDMQNILLTEFFPYDENIQKMLQTPIGEYESVEDMSELLDLDEDSDYESDDPVTITITYTIELDQELND